MASKKRKIIITISIIVALIVIIACVFVSINNKNKEIYQSATNNFINSNFKQAYTEFSKIENYKNSKEMKETCISQAEETANSMVETNEFEKAIDLYSFVAEHKDIAETTKIVKEQYLKYLIDNSEEGKAYAYLPNCPEINEELKRDVEVSYIVDLMYSYDYEQAISLMKTIENISEEDKKEIINSYIKASAYQRAYSSLYNSMRNPSSLNVRNVSYTLFNLDENDSFKALGYDETTGNFRIYVLFSFSGQNGYGGISSSSETYIYDGNINLETMDISLSHYRNY